MVLTKRKKKLDTTNNNPSKVELEKEVVREIKKSKQVSLTSLSCTFNRSYGTLAILSNNRQISFPTWNSTWVASYIRIHSFNAYSQWAYSLDSVLLNPKTFEISKLIFRLLWMNTISISLSFQASASRRYGNSTMMAENSKLGRLWKREAWMLNSLWF